MDLLLFCGGPKWDPPDRPPYDLPVHIDGWDSLPFTPPSGPDLLFHRGNFQLFVPGFGGGFNERDRSICMTWELPALSDEDVRKVLDFYATRFTHLLLSLPQAFNMGCSPDRLRWVMQEAKARGLFISLVVMDAEGGYSFEQIQPTLAGLVSLADILCVCWQADKWWSPFGLGNLVLAMSTYAKSLGKLLAIHWLNDACAWWAPRDGDDGACGQLGLCDRVTYQYVMRDKLDFHYWQIDPWATPDATQWQAGKVLQALPSDDPSPRFVVAEDDAQAQYDEPRLGEVWGAAKGFLNLCARWQNGNVARGGYFNDAVYPDGRQV